MKVEERDEICKRKNEGRNPKKSERHEQWLWLKISLYITSKFNICLRVRWERNFFKLFLGEL